MMSSLSSAMRCIVPPPVRRALRRVHRRHVFRQALLEVGRTSDQGVASSPDLLDALVYGWGNETFSARREFLAALLSYGPLADGPILECGSGLSTVILATVSRQHVWSLEHDSTWGKHTQAALDTHRRRRAHVLPAPLRNYGQFTWYDPPFAVMPRDFALVICDGPPKGTPGGRYGLLPLMHPRVRSGCVVLLDDAGRPDERRVLDQWVSEFHVTFSMAGERQRYAILSVPA